MENPFTQRINLIKITFSNPNVFEFNWNTYVFEFSRFENQTCNTIYFRIVNVIPYYAVYYSFTVATSKYHA